MNNPDRTHPVNVLIAGLLILLLLACTAWSARTGIAAVHAYPAKNALDQWRKQHLILQQNDWHLVQSRLKEALVYDSADPELLKNLGDAYESSVMYFPVGASSANANRNLARQYYLQALSIRPGWPYSWADLARIKYMLGEMDAGFNKALQNTVLLGPWEPGIQLTVAEIGLHQWHVINEENRRLVIRIINNGINQPDNTLRMFKLLKRYDMVELVCNETGLAPDILKHCLQHMLR